MNNKNILAFTCFLLFALLVVPALATTTYWTLNIYVYDNAMNPVNAEYIKVIDLSTGSTLYTRTNSQTLFVTLPQGNYNVSVYNSSFYPNVTTVNVNKPYPTYNVTLTRDTSAPSVTGVYAYTNSTGVAISASIWQTDNSPYFNWTTSDAAVAYNYTIDSAPYTTVTSNNVQYPVNALTNVQHIFKVKAKDAAGNWGSDATFNIWVDNSTPNIAGINAFTDSGKTVAIINNIWQTDNSPYFNWTDPSSPSDDTFYYTQDGSDPIISSPNTPNAYYQASAYTEGSTNFTVKARNGAGTWGSKVLFIVKYDGTAPTVSVTGTPSGWQKTDASAGVSCSDGSSGCNASTYALNTSATSITACPTSYAAYTLKTLPYTVSQHMWVCAAAKDNAGNVGFSSPANFTIDKSTPQWSNNKNNPASPATYAKGAIYQFNITWTDDTAVSEVKFTFDGKTYSSKLGEVLKSGNEYYITLTDLPAKITGYMYSWLANDTVGNTNTTPDWTYIINKASPGLAFVINPPSGITYGTQTNASCSAVNPEASVALYRNISGTPTDVTIAENNKFVTLPAGVWRYICNISATGNYSAASATLQSYIVNKKDPSTIQMHVAINGSETDQTFTYENVTNVTAWADVTGETGLEFKLYKETASTSEEIGNSTTEPYTLQDEKLLGANVYTYVYNTTGNANYLPGSVTRTLNIIQRTPSIVLTQAPSGTWTEAYPTETTVSCSIPSLNDEVTAHLWRDGVEKIPAVETVTLPANTYAYSCNSSATANYTGVQSDQTLTITASTENPVHLWLNGLLDQNNTITYGTLANATATALGGTLNMFRDGAPADSENGVNVLLTAKPEGYEYFVNATGDTNYPDNSTGLTYYLFVERAAATCSLDITPPTAAYPTPVMATCSCTNPETTATMYRDGAPADAENGVAIILPAGTHDYVCNATETNYTAASNSTSITVDKGTPYVEVFIDDIAANRTVVYPTTVTVIGNSTAIITPPTFDLYVASLTQTGNPASITTLQSPGTYQVIYNTSGNDNWTAATNDTIYLDVIEPTSICSLDITPSAAAYPTDVTATCACTNPEASAKLYRDGSDADAENGVATLLPAGSHDYVCNVTQTNYSSATNSTTYTVLKGDLNSYIQLLIEPSTSIDFGTESNATGWSNVIVGAADVVYTLWRDATSMGDGNPISDVNTLSAGPYVYTYNSTGGQNWTAGSVTDTLYVGMLDNPVELWLNGMLDQNVTMVYGTPSNATGVAASGNADLWRDGTQVTNPEIDTLPAGVYEYSVNSTGATNYWANTTGLTYYLEITKVDSAASLTVTPAGGTYPTAVTADCSSTNLEAPAVLWRNGADVTSTENGVAIVLPVDTYDYVCNVTETGNYTSASNSTSITILQNTSTTDYIHVAFDGAVDANRTYTYEDVSNATAYKDIAEGSLNFYKDGVLLTSLDDVQRLGYGTYNYTVEFSGSSNYAAASKTYWLTVDKKAISIRLELNGIESDLSGTYPVTLNATAWKDATVNDEGVLKLYENDSDVGGLSKVWDPAANVYVYKANFTADNYTAADVTYTATVAKGTSVIDITFAPNDTVTYGTETIATCAMITGDPAANITLLRDGSIVTNPDNVTLGAGTYNYSCTYDETENFTATSIVDRYITVLQATPTLALYLDGNSTDETVERGAIVNATAVLSIPENITMTIDGVPSESPSPYEVLIMTGTMATGVHIVNASVAGNTNYTAAWTALNLTVQDTMPPVVTIISPTNTTYMTNSIDLNWTSSEILSWAGYSLDGAANVTLTGNMTMTVGVGTHTLFVYAIDTAGLEGSANVTFIVPADTMPPSINKIWNTTDLVAGSPANFSINVTDNFAVANVTVNGTLATSIGTDVWETTIDIPSADGTYHWSVIATDTSGNSASRNITLMVRNGTVIIDLDPPVVSAIWPNYALTNQLVNISANVTDNTAVKECVLYIDGGSVINMTDMLPSNSTKVTATWTFYATGLYNLHARCWDMSDNWADGPTVQFAVNLNTDTNNTGSGLGGFGTNPPPQNATMTVTVQSPIIMDTGTTGIFNVYVYVGGKDLTNVKLSIGGMPYTYAVDPSSISMISGSSQTFLVAVAVPETAKSGVNIITVTVTTAEGLSASATATLIIKKPAETVEEVIANQTLPGPEPTPAPIVQSGLTGALFGVTSNPLTAVAIILLIIAILGWLWYKKPELFKKLFKKKPATDGGEKRSQ